MNLTDHESENGANESTNTNGWREYKLKVLYQLDTLLENGKFLEKDIRDLTQKIESLTNELAVTKTKLGFMSTGISVVVGIIASVVTTYFKG